MGLVATIQFNVWLALGRMFPSAKQWRLIGGCQKKKHPYNFIVQTGGVFDISHELSYELGSIE